MKQPNLKYYQSINGLRALAVILVVLYHLQFSWVKSGYLGVDIFFVISGFLISRILIEDLRAGEFSFRVFYSNSLQIFTRPKYREDSSDLDRIHRSDGNFHLKKFSAPRGLKKHIFKKKSRESLFE